MADLTQESHDALTDVLGVIERLLYDRLIFRETFTTDERREIIIASDVADLLCEATNCPHRLPQDD